MRNSKATVVVLIPHPVPPYRGEQSTRRPLTDAFRRSSLMGSCRPHVGTSSLGSRR